MSITNDRRPEIFKILEDPEIRKTEISGETWYAVKDVCVRLGFKNSRSAITKCEPSDLSKAEFMTSIGAPSVLNVIKESGVYHLVLNGRSQMLKRMARELTDSIAESSVQFIRYYEESVRVYLTNTILCFFMDDIAPRMKLDSMVFLNSSASRLVPLTHTSMPQDVVYGVTKNHLIQIMSDKNIKVSPEFRQWFNSLPEFLNNPGTHFRKKDSSTLMMYNMFPTCSFTKA